MSDVTQIFGQILKALRQLQELNLYSTEATDGSVIEPSESTAHGKHRIGETGGLW
jgi:hypothetical protein